MELSYKLKYTYGFGSLLESSVKVYNQDWRRNKALNIERQFPNQFDEFQRLCHDKNQTKPTVLILKYGKGGYITPGLIWRYFFPIQFGFIPK